MNKIVFIYTTESSESEFDFENLIIIGIVGIGENGRIDGRMRYKINGSSTHPIKTPQSLTYREIVHYALK